ncbi:PREDICTED: COBRA-like protein 9 [Camelina sativa]|uniref:COBRA-like protein 9 n=1 Tax=Camelina sativa TaxID=90675 RepID=A0ABM0UFH3_CAMSA|nr:PREDICTED: COBRA-like protein 9 [Camelina sativa]
MGLLLPILFGALLLLTITPPSLSQLPPEIMAPAPAPISPSDLCNGIFLSYEFILGRKIPPNDTSDQPYRFESLLTVLNNGREELKEWRVFVGFQHNEILISASDALIVNGTELPALVGNGTIFGGYPVSDLKTAIQTAGDLKQMTAEIELVGTQFMVAPPAIPLPTNISLVNDGWLCPEPTLQSKRELTTCCTRDASIKVNTTITTKFFPRQPGDLTIMYDVIRAYDQNYLTEVTMENHNPLGRLDHWELSFDWMRDEFIQKMQGAYPTVVDATKCIFGPQSLIYTGLDFADVLTCERRPVIIDLPPTKKDDPILGKIPFCCRNGTILPPTMDPSKSVSVFTMQVSKMPPDFNRSALFPPQNWRIKGTLNPDYACGPPVRVSPTFYPDPSGMPTNKSSFASWQIVCNITQAKTEIPKCCVSYSAFFNDSIIPCNTCACGCVSETRRTCNAESPSLLIPPDALLLPFENRTDLTLAWNALKHKTVPNPMPCGDNCGVSINWHMASDYRGGWTVRITIFNWGEIDFPNWFLAVQMKKPALLGFEKAYSFNASRLSVDGGVNNTIFMEGLPGLDYLVAEADEKDPKKKNIRIPGKQQSVIQFSKKLTPGINVAERDGFPAKVIFNGEECLLPDVLPMASGGRRNGFITVLSFITFYVAVFMIRL